MKVLTDNGVEHFIERGWCTLEGVFSRAQAAAACDVVWRRMEEKQGIRADDPSTWPAAYDIEERLAHPDVIACFTPRLAAAIEDLVGIDRWAGERRWGFWPVSFTYGADEPMTWPTERWHIDGNWFRHTIDCPRQGLLLVGFFTDVEPGSGGTVVAAGSHKRTARVLAATEDDLPHLELFERVLAEPIGGFCELVGAAGDAVLAHPFLFHSRGHKRHGPPRILSNSEVPLQAPLQLERSDGNYSVLERSIREALASPATLPPPDAVYCRF